MGKYGKNKQIVVNKHQLRHVIHQILRTYRSVMGCENIQLGKNLVGTNANHINHIILLAILSQQQTTIPNSNYCYDESGKVFHASNRVKGAKIINGKYKIIKGDNMEILIDSKKNIFINDKKIHGHTIENPDTLKYTFENFFIDLENWYWIDPLDGKCANITELIDKLMIEKKGGLVEDIQMTEEKIAKIKKAHPELIHVVNFYEIDGKMFYMDKGKILQIQNTL